MPQALVRWRQKCGGPWRLEVVEGGLGWGHPSLGRWWVEEETPQLWVGPRILGSQDGSWRRWPRGCSWRAWWPTRGGLSGTLRRGLP